jgi:hypothetical protein
MRLPCCLSVYPSMSVCLCTCLSVYVSVYVCLRIRLCLSVYPSVCLCICLCLFVYPSMSVCLSKYPSMSVCVYPPNVFVFYTVRVVSKERRWLVLPRTSCLITWANFRNFAGCYASFNALLLYIVVLTRKVTIRRAKNGYTSLSLPILYKHSFYIIGLNTSIFRI